MNCKPEAIEKTLLTLKRHIEEAKKNGFNYLKKGGNADTSAHGMNGYTNVISPVETPAVMMMNQGFTPLFMSPMPNQGSYGHPNTVGIPHLNGGQGGYGGIGGARHMIPPDTPISKVPPISDPPTQGNAQDRRRR